MLHTQYDSWENSVLVFHCSAVYLCVFPLPVKGNTQTTINLHMFIFTKVDLPINHMIPKWKECIHTHVYENAF